MTRDAARRNLVLDLDDARIRVRLMERRLRALRGKPRTREAFTEQLENDRERVSALEKTLAAFDASAA